MPSIPTVRERENLVFAFAFRHLLHLLEWHDGVELSAETDNEGTLFLLGWPEPDAGKDLVDLVCNVTDGLCGHHVDTCQGGRDCNQPFCHRPKDEPLPPYDWRAAGN